MLFTPKKFQKSAVVLAIVVAVSLISISSVVAASQSSPVVISTGLRNLGNTCYLNAQLQCAFHIPLVRDLILGVEEEKGQAVCDDNSISDDSDDESEKKYDEAPAVGTTTSKPDEESQGVLALRNVFGEMLQALTGKTGPVSPRVLTQTLGIPVMEQQDSQEFWKLLLPALKKPALTQLYAGALEDYIIALDGSKRERRRKEAFLDLSLDVSPDGKSSVMSSLQKLFGDPEILSVAEGNGWRPEKGADKVDAQKGYLLRHKGLPSILQLHLKRFNYDWNRDIMEKLNDPFEFPLELDLSSTVARTIVDGTVESSSSMSSCIYDLQSIVVHMGQFGVGHYYSYVRPDVNSNSWYRFNDDIVTPVSFDEVVADATGGKICGISAKRGLFGKIKGLFQAPSCGYGGRTSNAYVLQYVRRSEIPLLYSCEK
mmetsp:Transcript_1602/g.2281  ORF Transcript_1602/g.2281 Transcript_1602/m.2281 type:complete len:427 (-) Transcript_1602:255-1535(-)|eukprot:CAMPEP_0198150948 /NCGR_PEP_ID=MMETSP1443-20131203/53369_1 /TAXON_ID=186043 /ORGANISM="Entomoneis sp., Strain CCMP2396" /LENGTH=426 /DNA_ID=CAMNT_0043816447 /DNA_START=60 /DNA_END=1340 /DNA_ORIENTATION=-